MARIQGPTPRLSDTAGCSIQDEPDVGLYTTDFDVSFIGSLDITQLVAVVIDEWFDPECLISQIPV